MSQSELSPARVSVVIPCFNAEATLAGAVESVLAQTLSDLECVLVDDCSTDGTRALMARLAERDPRVRALHMEQNSGPSAARNAGIDAACGDWIAVLDSDDAYEPERLSLLVQTAEAERADFIADNQRLVDPEGRHLGLAFPDLEEGEAVAVLGLRRFLEDSVPVRGRLSPGYLKPLMRRDFLMRSGLRYDEGYTVGEDFLLYAQALMQGARFVVLPDALYRYTQRPSSLTRSGGWTLRVLASMCAEILREHSAFLPLSAREALETRRRIMLRRARALDLAGRLRARDPRGTAAILLREPSSLAALGREVVDVVGARRAAAAAALGGAGS